MRHRSRKAKGFLHIARDERPARARPPADQLIYGIGDRGLLGGDAGRDGDAQTVAKQRRIQRLGYVFAAVDTHPHNARTERIECAQRNRAMCAQLVDGNRAQHAQQVCDLLGGARLTLRGGALQLGVDFGDNVGVEKLAQLHRAQQLGQQRRVQGQGGRALFR